MTMNRFEREQILQRMELASRHFYYDATRIGNHPFIEFTGLMNEYIKACECFHQQGGDFTECNTHSGLVLPLQPYHLKYINEKLECIFTGQVVLGQSP